MHSPREDQYCNTCLIPASTILKKNEYRLISSQSIICKKKLCYNLRELSPAQISWLHTVRKYFVSHYEQLFSHHRHVNQELSWNSYLSSLNAENAYNSYRYVQDQWYPWNTLTDFNIDDSADNNDNNNNNNIDHGDINEINNDDMENENNRDWLDNFYILSRIFILFSIVYFYSSPVRFFVVAFLGFLIYLYHNRLLRIDQNINNNFNHNEERQENRNPVNSVAQSIQSQRINEETHQTDLLFNNENRHVWSRTLCIIWTFCSSFFTSLIPGHPNVA